MQDNVKYWVDISDYDLETADAMLQTKRYLYVGFMCHQVIEKILKALYTKLNNEIPPYTHNLNYLCELTKIDDELSEEQKQFMDDLEPLNIDSRYPSYKQKLNKMLNLNRF